MNSAADLLREIDAFLERSGMAQTTFGVEVMNNTSFVRQLRRGGSVTLRTLDKVRAYIADADAAAKRNGGGEPRGASKRQKKYPRSRRVLGRMAAHAA